MYVDPGELNKRIQIIRKYNGEEYNDEGHPVVSEEIIRSCWAKVTNTTGTELVRAGSEFAEAKKRFLVRYSPKEINASMFVRYNGADHDILYVNPFGDSKEYQEIWTDIRERVK